MDGDYISRQEHKEFEKRMDVENQRLAEEDKRQNARIAELEENVKEIHKLTVSMERMAANMESMLAAIERQGNLIEKQNSRIEKMEQEPADNYKRVKMLIITTVVSAIIGGIVSRLIPFL